MARPAISGFSVLRAALLGTTALVLLGPGIALARVGVTSATDGDPRGKPPQEAERILRIGIDVQANEAITTGANDRAQANRGANVWCQFGASRPRPKN